MILQTQVNLAKIKRYGCYLLSIIYLTCKNAGYDTSKITSDFVIKVYRLAIDRKAMQPDCYILLPTLLAQIIAEQLKLKTHVVLMRAVAKKPSIDLASMFTANNFIIGCYAYNTSTHFLVMKSITEHEYDPLGGTSNTVKNGVLAGVRIWAASSK